MKDTHCIVHIYFADGAEDYTLHVQIVERINPHQRWAVRIFQIVTFADRLQTWHFADLRFAVSIFLVSCRLKNSAI
jgi:hypothetical protein